MGHLIILADFLKEKVMRSMLAQRNEILGEKKKVNDPYRLGFDEAYEGCKFSQPFEELSSDAHDYRVGFFHGSIARDKRIT